MQDTKGSDEPLPPNQLPIVPSNQLQRTSRGLRTGAILLLTLVLLAVFGIGLFAGWQFGTSRGTGALQPGTNTGSALPPLNSENQAGLKSGDVIVQMDGTAINDQSSLSNVLLSKKPGDTTSVQIYRGSQQQIVQVRLGHLQIG
ncbi:MAG: PDZ domain-containing protein [Ktedonobacteraceae bacterium]